MPREQPLPQASLLPRKSDHRHTRCHEPTRLHRAHKSRGYRNEGDLMRFTPSPVSKTQTAAIILVSGVTLLREQATNPQPQGLPASPAPGHPPAHGPRACPLMVSMVRGGFKGSQHPDTPCPSQHSVDLGATHIQPGIIPQFL